MQILIIAILLTGGLIITEATFVNPGNLNSKDDGPRVKTPLGGIRGYYKTSSTGRKYAAFEGIPYALPPTGSRRFEPPYAISAWLKDIEAKSLANSCIQKFHPFPVMGDEDCLYLNIYVPIDVKNVSLPVLFYIHGGAFQAGSSSLIPANNVMNKDLVFVTINYRLGAFGFLSTGDEVVPGNMGLKDQNMALRWVSKNIKYFGGDPKRITLAGESAGAISVHYHYLSPMSKGLFQNGISFSGTAMCPLSHSQNPRRILNLLIAETNCKKNSSVEIIGCLKRMSANNILEIIEKLNSQEDFLFPYLFFIPVSENVKENYFVNRSPKDILEKGPVYDVPWINTNTKDEGLIATAAFIKNKEVMSYINDNWRQIAPYFLQYAYSKPETEHIKLADSIKKHYFGDKPISVNKDIANNLTKLGGDYWFLTSNIRAAKMQAHVSISPVWSYFYTYKANVNYHPSVNETENLGVNHCEDVMLSLYTDIMSPSITPKDRAMVENMLDFWYSFATTGKPKLGNEWTAVNSGNFKYLHIAGPKNMSMEHNDNFGDVQFWNSIGMW